MSASTDSPSGQQELLSVPSKKARRKPVTRRPAEQAPVARVAVDTQLPHLDRPFDYLVPDRLDAAAVPGCRVRVRFAGQLVDGFLLERVEESDHPGRLAYLERVVSPEAVLTPEIAGLARAVADRYAGTLTDVLRLAIPPRHAATEKAKGATQADTPQPPPPGPWAIYENGPAFLRALTDGKAPRGIWTAVPASDPYRAIAAAVQATLAGGRGAVVVLPDGRDVALADEAMAAELGEGRHVALTADLGPAERYRRWLRLLRGEVRAVVGTRAAMFAPVADLGLAVLWDDGDDLHAEPHAPYPHAREVLALRAHRTDAGALIGGHARTAETTQMIETGWAHPLAADRTTVRRYAPRVRPLGDDAELSRDEAARQARLPTLAWRTAREGLAGGPVLVQVPRRGYLPALACQECRAPARCPCGGPLGQRSGHAAPACLWCGRIAGAWECPSCGGRRLRAVVVGAGRTAEELGRAFPSVPVRLSGGDAVIDRVAERPALVVATPGGEPPAAGGYAAALLLDGWALLGRADLRAAEETVRRWLNAAALVRPGGPVVVLAESGLAPVQALLRWDPVTHAERELADRAALGFPPRARMASLTGTPAAVREMVAETALPPGAEVLGPVPEGGAQHPGAELERALIRVARSQAAALARALKAASATRSARKAAEVVRVRIDPLDLV